MVQAVVMLNVFGKVTAIDDRAEISDRVADDEAVPAAVALVAADEALRAAADAEPPAAVADPADSPAWVVAVEA